MSHIRIPVHQLPHGAHLPLPHYATEDSAGMDLYAAISDPIILASLERHLVPAGIQIGLPRGFEGQIRPRSGFAFRHGITVLNAPGTIDADYRGEICVLLVNLSKDAVTIAPGERIAQMVIVPVQRAEWQPLAEKDFPRDTARAAGGFGSTGRF